MLLPYTASHWYCLLCSPHLAPSPLMPCCLTHHCRSHMPLLLIYCGIVSSTRSSLELSLLTPFKHKLWWMSYGMSSTLISSASSLVIDPVAHVHCCTHRRFGWSRVGILASTDVYGSGLASVFLQRAHRSSLQVAVHAVRLLHSHSGVSCCTF